MADTNPNTGIAHGWAKNWIWWAVGIVAVIIIAFMIWGGQRNNGISRYDSSPAAGRRTTGPNRPNNTQPSQGTSPKEPTAPSQEPTPSNP